MGLFSLSVSGCVGAGSVMDDFDPNQVRIITPTEATSTCIGDPRTPICAIETLLACVARRNVDLCRRVGVSTPCFDSKIVGVRYRIGKVGILNKTDIPRYAQEMKRSDDPVVEVLYDYRWCMVKGSACDPLTSGVAPVLVESGGRWLFPIFPLEANQCRPEE